MSLFVLVVLDPQVQVVEKTVSWQQIVEVVDCHVVAGRVGSTVCRS